MSRSRPPLAAITVLAVFAAIMLFVTVTAYGRRSGATGLDIGTVHMLRLKRGTVE